MYTHTYTYIHISSERGLLLQVQLLVADGQHVQVLPTYVFIPLGKSKT